MDVSDGIKITEFDIPFILFYSQRKVHTLRTYEYIRMFLSSLNLNGLCSLVIEYHASGQRPCTIMSLHVFRSGHLFVLFRIQFCKICDTVL